MIRWILYFGQRTLRNIREEWALNLRVVTGFGLMVFVVGIFMLAGTNLEMLLDRWGEQLQVTAYLKKGLDLREQEKVRAAIAKLPDVEEAALVSESLALSRFRKDLGGLSGVLDGLEENPLPASIEIRVPPARRTGEVVARLAEDLTAFSNISEVQYGQEWVERYRIFLETLSLLGLGLACILLFVGWGSISNLIQLTIFARKDEIGILKLVGATDRFVRTPFLIEGSLQGLAASLLALGLLYILFFTGFVRLSKLVGGFLGNFDVVFLSPAQVLAVIVASVSLGLLASFVATGRHLDV